MEYYIRRTDPYYLFHDHISTQVKLMLLLAPLERIKTVLQVQASRPSTSEFFPSAKSVISHIYTKQGVAGFWRGNLLPLLFFPPTKLINQNLQQTTNNFELFDQAAHPTLHKIERSVLGNPVIWTWGLLLYPVYTIKTQMNLELGDKKEFKSYSSYFSKVFKMRMTELYSGFFFTLFIPYCFSQYLEDRVKAEMGTEIIRNSSVFALSMIVTGSIVKFVTYPFKTVQFSLMMQSGEVVKKYSSPGECLSHIMKTEGYRGLYKGFYIDFFCTLFKLLYISYNHSYF